MVGNQACTSSGSDAQSVLSNEVQPSHLLEPSSTGSNSFRPPFPRSTPTTPARPSATIIFGALHHPDGFVPPRRVNYVSENSSDVHAVSNPIRGRLDETSSCEQPLIEITNPMHEVFTRAQNSNAVRARLGERVSGPIRQRGGVRMPAPFFRLVGATPRRHSGPRPPPARPSTCYGNASD